MFESSIVDMARGMPLPAATEAVVASHLQVCGACTGRLQRERELTRGFRAIAQQTASRGPAAEMEARLLDAFAHLHRQPSGKRTVSRTWLAAAAALLLVAAAGVWAAATLNRAGRIGTSTADARPAREFLDGFVFLPVAAGLPPLESGLIVRVEVPVSALPKYGVEVISDSSKSRIQADLLVGQDGQPRAIRIVSGDAAAEFTGPRSRP